MPRLYYVAQTGPRIALPLSSECWDWEYSHVPKGQLEMVIDSLCCCVHCCSEVRAEELLDGIQEKIPSFQGLKFSDTDLLDFGQCVDQNQQQQFALLFGVDEVSYPLGISQLHSDPF